MSMTFDASFVLVVLNRLAVGNYLAAWMEFVAEAGKAEVEQRIIHSKRDPEGQAWVPWADSYAERQSDHGLLLDKGRLLASLVASSDRVSASVESVGVPYAEMTQQGTPSMPARPYLGWSPVSLAKLERDLFIMLESDL